MCRQAINTIECLFFGTIGLIGDPWKSDFLKTSIFPMGNYQPIVP